MKLSASTFHPMFGKIRFIGYKMADGKCFVTEVFKWGSLTNLLSFEFNDRKFPCGGFTPKQVDAMNLLLETQGVEVFECEVPVLVYDQIEDVAVTVVFQFQNGAIASY